MNMQQTRRLAAGAMAGAAGLAIAGFTALGSIFDYPKILKEPTDEILATYASKPDRRHWLVSRPGDQRCAACPHRVAARPDRRWPAW